MAEQAYWYVVHTYSGYENKVATDLMTMVENRRIQDHREELAALLNISENQLSYITNVSVGSGLIRCSGNIVPFENTFPKNTDLYKLMTTKPGES